MASRRDSGIALGVLAAGLVAGAFLVLNLRYDGFPLRCVTRVTTKMGIGLPEGVTYEQWYRERFGKELPPPELKFDRVALALNVVCGVASTVLVAGVAIRVMKTKPHDTIQRS